MLLSFCKLALFHMLYKAPTTHEQCFALIIYSIVYHSQDIMVDYSKWKDIEVRMRKELHDVTWSMYRCVYILSS